MTAAAFELALLRTEDDAVLPRPSANACTFEIAEVPKPGPDVTWRTLGGDAGTPADPDGWFLQRRDRLATSQTGVFCTITANRVTFERHDADDDLWRAVRLLAGTRAACGAGTACSTPADWLDLGDRRDAAAGGAAQAVKWTSPRVAGPSGLPQCWTNVASRAVTGRRPPVQTVRVKSA